MEIQKPTLVSVEENIIQTDQDIMRLIASHSQVFRLVNHGKRLKYIGTANPFQQVTKVFYRLRGKKLIFFRTTTMIEKGKSLQILPVQDCSEENDNDNGNDDDKLFPNMDSVDINVCLNLWIQDPKNLNLLCA